MKTCFKILYEWINLIAFVIVHATSLFAAFSIIMLVVSAITQNSPIVFELIIVLALLSVVGKKLKAYLVEKFSVKRTVEEIEELFPKWCKMPRAFYIVLAMINVVVMVASFNLMFIENRPSTQQFESMSKYYFGSSEDISTETCILMMLPTPLTIILNDCYYMLTEVSDSMSGYSKLTGDEKEEKHAVIEERAKELRTKFEKDLSTSKVNGIFATVLLLVHGFLLYPATTYNNYKEALRRCKDDTITLQI